MNKRSVVFSPYFVMAVVLLMYIVKVTAKISIGTYVNSPVITGDGYHNVADIFEAFLVIAVIFYATRPQSDDYPFGRKNVENIFSLAVGTALCITAFQLAIRCALHLIRYVPSLDAWMHSWVSIPEQHALLMGPQYFWYVFCVTGGSAFLSFLIGRYQIYVGRKTSSGSLVADGSETLSDGRIEFAAFVGVVGEYYYASPFIEYPLGLFVAFLVFRTGREIAAKGWNALLQRSIGKEKEDGIRNVVKGICGVVDVAQLKTFLAGERVVCILKVITRCGERTNIDIKYAIAKHVRRFLEDEGFEESEFFIRFDKPEPHRHRIAYGMVRNGSVDRVSLSLQASTHIRVCDVEDGVVVRWKDEVAPVSVEEKVILLARKRVQEVRVFGNNDTHAELERLGIRMKRTISTLSEVLGIS